MLFRYARYVLLACAAPMAAAQVLFPGNSLERPSRSFHVIHYKLVIGFDEAQKQVSGTASISLSPLSLPLDSLTLDAADMDVRSVTVPSGPLRFANRSPHLVVFFDKPLRDVDTTTISVEYSCKPTTGLYFIQPDSTNPRRRRQIWSQGEDTDNHFWFPCYDYPNDKATSEVIATVPEAYVLLSNGTLLGTSHDPVKKTNTFHWFESRPHSSYLIMVAAGEYDLARAQYRDIPLEYYVYKDRVQDGVRCLAITPLAMKFFEDKIGVPYPWEKYAQIWITDFMWGGMENVSAVTLNDEGYLLDSRAQVDFTSDDVVVHELAHQWWGDLVTSRDWNNLWLHEGFANYFEVLFKEHEKGEDYFQYDLMQQASSVVNTEDAQGRSPLVGQNGYTANIYSKGCWVLHMLRNILGEEGFWKAMHLYATRFAYRNADSYELMLAIEDATGRNLGWFFDQWVYKAGYPKIFVTSVWNDTTRTLQLEFDQTQVIDSLTPVFRFPLTVECTTSARTTTTTVEINQLKQTLNIPLPEKPLMVIPDRGKKVLATFDWQKTATEYVYQLGHAPDIADRITAARQLQKNNQDPAVFEVLTSAALNDHFWAVRQEALLALASSDDLRKKDALLQASRDVHSSVRATAVAELSHFHDEDVATAVWNAALSDSSYLVLSSCIGSLAKIDSARGFDLAARCVGMESYRDIVRRAALQAFVRLKDSRAIPFALTYTAISVPVDLRIRAVEILGAVGSNVPESKKRLMSLVDDPNSSIRIAAIEGLASQGDIGARPIIVKRRDVETDGSVRKAIERALETLSSATSDYPGEK